MKKTGQTILLLGLLACVACSSEDVEGFISGPVEDAAWVGTAAALMIDNIGDGMDDHDPSEPPYSQPVDYAATDVVGLSFGADSEFLYLRVDFAGVIPTAPVEITASGEVEAQTVTGQSFSFVLDTDNNNATGAGAQNFQGNGGMEGVDIFFGISFDYGAPVSVYSNYDFTGGDIHLNQGQIIGEVGSGGPGTDYILVRYPVGLLEQPFWPKGLTVEAGGWSEAESNLYHEFSNDFLVPRLWTIPQ